MEVVMKTNDLLQRNIKRSVWFFYALIVLEILYMISPFALYFYSLYKVPLKWLQSSEATAFLTQTVLPHFAYHTSGLIQLLVGISWPLILIGSALFLVAFGQIYWAKFTRKGAVSGGLYRFIRHPQYLALAILGLGTTLYWSRFLVCLMYVTMLFLYSALARQEEEICKAKFGSSYMHYLERTGRFLPRSVENSLRRFVPQLSLTGWSRRAVLFAGYGISMVALVLMGFMVRDYALDQMVITESSDRVVVALTELTQNELAIASSTALADAEVQERLQEVPGKKELIYVVPDGWSIPELGIESGTAAHDYLANSVGHGNTDRVDLDRLLVLICRPVLRDENVGGRAMLKNAQGIIPLMEVTVGRGYGSVIRRKLRQDSGKWAGIPVPLY